MLMSGEEHPTLKIFILGHVTVYLQQYFSEQCVITTLLEIE